MTKTLFLSFQLIPTGPSLYPFDKLFSKHMGASPTLLRRDAFMTIIPLLFNPEINDDLRGLNYNRSNGGD